MKMPNHGISITITDRTAPSTCGRGDDATAARPRGNVMVLRRSYYQALSNMLDAQSLQKKVAEVNAQDCDLVAEVQNRLYEAADSNLLGYYRHASAPMPAWLATYCSANQ